MNFLLYTNYLKHYFYFSDEKKVQIIRLNKTISFRTTSPAIDADFNIMWHYKTPFIKIPGSYNNIMLNSEKLCAASIAGLVLQRTCVYAYPPSALRLEHYDKI